MNTEEALECRSLRIVIGIIITGYILGIVMGLAAGRAIWKKEPLESAPHYSMLNTNGEVLYPSTQHIIGRLAQMSRDLDRLLFLTSNANAALRDPRGSGKWGGQATNSP